MSVSTRALRPLQDQIIQENFDYLSPFFRGRDLHAMLDCACAPELALASDRTQEGSIALNVPVSIPFNAKLREEFFGGILYDCD